MNKNMKLLTKDDVKGTPLENAKFIFEPLIDEETGRASLTNNIPLHLKGVKRTNKKRTIIYILSAIGLLAIIISIAL